MRQLHSWPAIGSHLREVLFGPPPAPYRDEIMSALYMQVLRPLCWLGLLAKLDKEFQWEKQSFAKTPLWRAALKLETDRHLSPPVKH